MESPRTDRHYGPPPQANDAPTSRAGLRAVAVFEAAKGDAHPWALTGTAVAYAGVRFTEFSRIRGLREAQIPINAPLSADVGDARRRPARPDQ